MANHAVSSNLDKSRFFRKPLRLHLARLGRQGTQDGQKRMHTSKLSLNEETRIMTTLDHFQDKPARYYRKLTPPLMELDEESPLQKVVRR
jgi:hypothetical protein